MEINNMRTRHIITQEIEQKIIHMYIDEKMSGKTIQGITGISSTEVYRILKKNGHQTRNLITSHKIYDLDFSFFKDIDTEEKAYILGLLFADGSHDSNIGRVVLVLQEQDKKLLENINILLNNTRPLRKEVRKTPKGKINTYYELSFHDRGVSADLLKLGLIPNKTYNMCIPEMPKELLRHFIRGFWDGDGNIYLGPRNKNFRSTSVAATSNKIFCEQLQQVIKEQTDLNFSVRKAHSNNSQIQQIAMSNKKVRNFLDYLYQDAHIYMDRKYQKYLEIVNWQDIEQRGEL